MMTDISSADFCKLSLQEVADFLLDHESESVLCKGLVDGRMYNLSVRLELVDDECL